MTKIFNFALKIKGGGRQGGMCEVLRHCHLPPKFGTCTCDCTCVWLFIQGSKSSVLFDAFCIISCSFILSILVMSDLEGSFSSVLFSIVACRAVNLLLGISKPKLRSLSLPNTSAIVPIGLSLPLIVKGMGVSLQYNSPSIISKFSK